jgi:multicomponent Na+:H+ antiporter subunit B
LKKLCIIKKVITNLILPIVVIFGIYVQIHGEISPGGGFQAGVILASVVILHSLAFGSNKFLNSININSLQILSALGVLIYLATGMISILKGGNFLDYSIIFPSDYIFSQEFGVFIVEIGVGITVFSVMLVLYFCFNEKFEE